MNDMTTLPRLNVGHWAEDARMEQSRSHTPVVTIDGKLYIFGGGGNDFKSLNSSAVFDPISGHWDTLSPMPTARSGTIACAVDGRAYIIGGGFKQKNGMFRFLTTVEIYDPKTDRWETGPDMLMPHDYPGGTRVGHYIYILGGHHPDATKSGPKTDPGFDFCERLNLTTGQWEALAPLPTPRFALSALPSGGKILAMGGVAFTPEGFNNFTLIEAYDPATNTWEKLTHLALPWPAAGQSNCFINEDLFIFGGYSGDGIHNRAAVYRADEQQWQQLPDIPAPRCATGIGLIDKTIYLVGGWADDGRTPVDTLFSYTYP